MAIFKVKQKLALDKFQKLRAQVKEGKVKVVTRTDGNVVIMGSVKDAINLGRKIEVHLCEDGANWVDDNSAFVVDSAGNWSLGSVVNKG